MSLQQLSYLTEMSRRANSTQPAVANRFSQLTSRLLDQCYECAGTKANAEAETKCKHCFERWELALEFSCDNRHVILMASPLVQKKSGDRDGDGDDDDDNDDDVVPMMMVIMMMIMIVIMMILMIMMMVMTMMKEMMVIVNTTMMIMVPM